MRMSYNAIQVNVVVSMQVRCLKLAQPSYLHVVLGDEDLARVRVVHQLLQRPGVHVVQRHILLQLLHHIVCGSSQGSGNIALKTSPHTS